MSEDNIVLTEEDVAKNAVVEVSYDDLIPNNVDLANDRRLKKALESWHPGYIDWWKDAGPDGFHESEVYLRTAVGVDPKGWAVFDHVKMPDYRWGVLLAPQVEGRTIPCGKHKGEPVW
jgi:benzoyl-CoA 2,3-epoxidase subunit B